MGDMNTTPSNLAPAVSPLQVMLCERDKTRRQDTSTDWWTGIRFPQFPMSSSSVLKISVVVPIYLCLSSLWDMWSRINKVFRLLPLETFLWTCRMVHIRFRHHVADGIWPKKPETFSLCWGLAGCVFLPSAAAMLCNLSPLAKLGLRMPAQQWILFTSS